MIDYTYVQAANPPVRLENAFSVAERDLGVNRLLEPEGEEIFPFIILFTFTAKSIVIPRWLFSFWGSNGALSGIVFS